jgi:glycine dehydrogenase subunit 1
MRYTPHTAAERAQMLSEIGVATVEELFADVPEHARFPGLALPDGISELELARTFDQLAERNQRVDQHPCFLGAGAYHHFTPAVIPHLLFRSEFYTAYTPYQPEVSQGTLQSTFEFQSMLCGLFGMQVANASMYDGSTALAEAALMALRLAKGKRRRLLVSEGIHPEYREVAATYTRGMDVQLEPLPLDAGGITSGVALQAALDEDCAGLLLQYPNFLGQIEAVAPLATAVHAAGGVVVVVADPIACARLRPPGDLGADIVVAEGQPLGIPLFYGGPYVGLFATKQEHVRQMPGRLVGMAHDDAGRRGFVLTLKTREQDIRREKATSNICTNEALIATAVTIYLSAMGKTGLGQVADHCYHKAHYLIDRLLQIPGVRPASSSPYYREAALSMPGPAGELNRLLWDRYQMIGGFDLAGSYPQIENGWLLTATEMNSRADIDAFVAAVAEILA